MIFLQGDKQIPGRGTSGDKKIEWILDLFLEGKVWAEAGTFTNCRGMDKEYHSSLLFIIFHLLEERGLTYHGFFNELENI